jgi:Tol biopolymer transport system component/DNA-binding winged helix-turn-helix (wHTH) protein
MSKRGGRLYEFGPYRLLPSERLLLRDDEPVALTPKAFELLVALVERGGRLVEKEELLGEVWAGTAVEESNIAQNVFALRRVLGRSEDGGHYIETVPKRGYRFRLALTVSDDAGVEPFAGRRGRQPGAQNGTPTSSDAPHVAAFTPPNAARGAQALSAGHVPRRRKTVLLLLSSALALALVGVGAGIARLFNSPPPPAVRLVRLMSSATIRSAAVSPDGRYVAHVVDNAGQTSIWVRQVSTTTDLHIIPPDRGVTYWGLTFSRDGDHLYYIKSAPVESSPGLYRVPALGGSSRRIVADINSPVTTSPDGKQIAFVRDPPGESVLLVANADGSNERRLAVRRRPGSYFSGTPRGGPSWSPDGLSIANGVISLDGGHHGEVVVFSVSDGSERPLTSHRWYYVAQVAWLSDGSGLLAAARESSIAQIWHVSFPDGAVRKVTNDLSDYHGVSLTADSRTLVTVQFERPSTIIFVPEKPPTASKRSTAGMDEGFYGLSWTPDDRLVYASEAAGNLDIWLMGTDGVTAEQLTTDPHFDSTPAVSPDGRSVVFLSSRDGDIPHVWRMDIDGGNQRRLTNQASEGTPSYTPDGRWVVYAVSGSGVWKIPAEGGEPVLIASGYAHTPRVSPDGSLVACTYRDEGRHASDKIALFSIEGGPPIKVFDEPKDLSSSAIRWTADGRALIYVGTRDGVSNLWTLPLDGSQQHRLTDFNTDLIFNFSWSRSNKQLALARGNTAEHVVLIDNFR